MIETLYVNGCSWTAGNELEQSEEYIDYLLKDDLKIIHEDENIGSHIVDCNGQVAGKIEDYYNLFNWAGRIQKNLEIPNIVNDALGGASNHRILRTTVDYILRENVEDLKKTLVVIGWTISSRNELYIQTDYGSAWQVFNATQPVSMTYDRQVQISEEQLSKLDEYQKFHTAYIHNDYTGIFEYFQGAYLLSNLLENLQVPYLFFNALPPWWIAGQDQVNIDVFQHFPDEIKWQINHSRLLHFNNNMFGFILDKEFKTGKYRHPLVDGHAAWGDYLTRAIKARL